MKSKGVSLIELIIAMAVLSIAIAVIFYGYISISNIFTEEMSESAISVETNRALEQMTKDLRNNLAIVAYNSHSITIWYQDLNSNGTRETAETISYTWDGTSGHPLVKTIGTSTYTAANQISNFILTYSITTDATLINIYIAVTSGSKIGTFESSVQCRNL